MTASNRGLEVITRFMRDLNTIDCDGLTISPDSKLGDDLGLNSLSTLLLVVWIKDHVRSDVFDHVGNVSDLVSVRDVLALMPSLD